MRFSLLSILACGLLVGISTASHAVVISAYMSAPESQSAPASFTGTTVATFDSLLTGNLVSDYVLPGFGTYTIDATHRFAVVADDQYGNGTGNYVSLGAQSNSSAPVTLTFAAPGGVRYFGFAYQAGDTQNGITFYDGNTMVGRFSTGSILSLLGNRNTGRVRAVNNDEYNSSQYFGKANTTTNNGEPYSFVNFFATGGTFTSVVFDNSNTTGTGFETDNHTISVNAQTPQGDFVFVGVVVPESNTITLFGAGGLSILGMILPRRRSNR